MNRKERRAGRGSVSASQIAHAFAEAVEHRKNGALELADGFCRNILAVDPRHAGCLHLLGSIAIQQGRPDAAVEQIGKAVAIEGRNAAYQTDLGLALQALGRLDEAIACYRRVIQLEPESGRGYNNLAVALEAQGKNAEAAAQYVKALERTAELFETFGDVCTTLFKLNPVIAAAVKRAADAWPRRLTIAELFGADGYAKAANDPLLQCMLASAPGRFIPYENLLTDIRRALLDSAGDADDGGSDVELRCALARQCFINEFMFDVLPEELDAAERLKQSLAAACATKSKISPRIVAAVASYFPLASVASADNLLDRAAYPAWPAALDAILTQQLREPREERRLRETIPALTAVEDATSLKVKQQYEENPYPRWVLADSKRPATTVDEFLRKQFPLVPFRTIGKSDGSAEILVAGCGTGKHPIGVARQFPTARVLAVDLSLASLAYAQRKARELKIGNLTFAQADILKLGSIGKTFDMIDCAGVLHHLADPEAGWRVLLSLLRPDGVMHLGLYSESARRDIVAARAFIAERGFGSGIEDIRAARGALLKSDLHAVSRWGDFFTTSECRDLLFHVQEQRFTVARMRAFLEQNALRFIGFELPQAAVVDYRRRFFDDPALRDLRHWEQFEAERPDTFVSMYQFWVARQ